MALSPKTIDKIVERINRGAPRIDSSARASHISNANGRNSTVYQVEDFAIKKHTRDDDGCQLESHGRLGDAVWEYVIGEYVRLQGFPIPERHGIIAEHDGRPAHIERDRAKDYTPLLVMDRVVDAHPEAINPRKAEELRNKLRDLPEEIEKETGIDPEPATLGRNALYERESDTLYLIDITRWRIPGQWPVHFNQEPKPSEDNPNPISFPQLFQEHKPPIYTPRGNRLHLNSDETVSKEVVQR